MSAAVRRGAVAALLILGLASIVGTALESVWPTAGRAIGGFGKLSLASPFPKVFCKVGDEEPFGMEHAVTLEHEGGERVLIPIDRDRYARFEAPYQHRNVYGAAFAFAPRLRPETRGAVVAYGFCDGGALLDVAGKPLPSSRIAAVTIASFPRSGALGRPRAWRIECPR